MNASSHSPKMLPSFLISGMLLCTLNACERKPSGTSPVTATLAAVEPAALAQETPAATPAPAQGKDDQSSRLWAMRKKVQQRSTQRTGSYLEQLNAALAEGDRDGAESALKAAIAQGTLTQAQIVDVRSRIDAQHSQQQAALLAAAQTRETAARQAAAAARTPSEGTAPAMPAVASASSAPPDAGGKTTELQRFATRFAGRDSRFTCTKDRSGGNKTGMTSFTITLKDQNSGKEWAVEYGVAQLLNRNQGNTGGLTVNNESLAGATLEVRFNAKGEPVSIKNPSNGNSCEVSDWWVTGYGW